MMIFLLILLARGKKFGGTRNKFCMYLSVAIGTVQFNQSEYTVDEGTSEVQICLTAQGYDFSVIIETEAATATGTL